MYIMSIVYSVIIYLFVVSLSISGQQNTRSHTSNKRAIPINKWIIKIDDHLVEQLIKLPSLIYHGQVTGKENHHVVEWTNKSKVFVKNTNIKLISRLNQKYLYKRDLQSVDLATLLSEQDILSHHFKSVKESYDKRLDIIQHGLVDNSQFDDIFNKTLDWNDRKPEIVVSHEKQFDDQLWPLQWYEISYSVTTGEPVLDMHIVPVYLDYNITGNGVNVVIIDDGIEYTHDDIKDNFDPRLSFNFNFNKSDVMPRYEDPRNKHGTRCAGVVVMKANNNKCGVGIAYNAKIGGIVLLDGPTDDFMEQQAVTFAIDRVDIYSGSWGPLDSGQALDGPGLLLSDGIRYGITHGRHGKGALYVFAAGNGGIFGDHCGADGYVNSIYSIAVASATWNGGVPYYSERCPAIITTTYSGAKNDDIKIVTTDIHNKCTLQHSGTSASAPLAVGILSLALEANSALTWRDVQHLIVISSENKLLIPDIDWEINGFGLSYTPRFGFGLLNAHKLVTLSMNWTTVPEKYICAMTFNLGKFGLYREFSSENQFTGAASVTACEIQFVEHIQLNATMSYPVRGNLAVDLISPYGTVSKLLEPRRHDKSADGFSEWLFMSMQFWGEHPAGTWAVIISDQVKLRGGQPYKGQVQNLQLIIHGMRKIPEYYLFNDLY